MVGKMSKVFASERMGREEVKEEYERKVCERLRRDRMKDETPLLSMFHPTMRQSRGEEIKFYPDALC